MVVIGKLFERYPAGLYYVETTNVGTSTFAQLMELYDSPDDGVAPADLGDQPRRVCQILLAKVFDGFHGNVDSLLKRLERSCIS